MSEAKGCEELTVAVDGVFGCMVALALLKRRPQARLTLVVEDDRFAGATPELLLIDRACPQLLPLWESAIVKSWDRHYIVRDDDPETIVGDVALIDPGQLYLDLVQSSLPILRVLTERGSNSAGSGSTTGSMAGITATVIDVRDAVTRDLIDRSATRGHRDLQQQHRLDAPILADFSFASEDHDYLELVPLDGSRVMAHQVRLNGGLSPKQTGIPTGAHDTRGATIANLIKRRDPSQLVIPLRAHWAEQLAMAIVAIPVINPDSLDAIRRSQCARVEALCRQALPPNYN